MHYQFNCTLPGESITPGTTGSPTEGTTGSPTEGATGSPTEGATGSPTEGATGSPTEGATESPTEGATGCFAVLFATTQHMFYQPCMNVTVQAAIKF